ncbi:MAG: argininosuccinate synthase domain-containing protein [Vicinamibacterales bacterium]
MEHVVLPVLTPAAAGAVTALASQGGIAVVAVAIDVGQGGALDALRVLALDAGAAKCHAVDARDTLAERACWPALAAGALEPAGEPIHTALTMPVVASTVFDIARLEGLGAAAPWAEDAGDRRRLRALLRDLAPSLGLVSTAGGTDRAITRNAWAEVTPAPDGPLPDARPPASGAVTLRIGFAHGLPVSVNGVAATPLETVDSLATIAHDLGAWTVRDPDAPRAWRVRAPAAALLARAAAALAARVLDPTTAAVAALAGEQYAGVVRDGAWFRPVREGLDAFVARVLRDATGEVTMHLDGGRIEVEA